ncbi:UDP-N-acetylmuramoyl-L-alanyl-D-glutamate--2,6-diaminopimelate ligase [Helicobacter didelphidarum]|nr:UDP-N-acetylmuramoyl-L-alanyl-D-glutamate--2,6-diaminopimelate ligase [Helicobacter didelphidarum]
MTTTQQQVVPHITDDTRELRQDSLFLQIPQNEKFLASLPAHTKIIQRDDLKKYFNLNLKIIGITGTNGKTTTAAIIYSVLLDMGYKVALLGTRGMFVNDKQIKPKGLTTPKLIELYQDIHTATLLGCEYFVMEVSSHAIKQERIYGLEFYTKILTNITSDHLDYHKTWEDYAQTKLNFLQTNENNQCIKIINLDDPSAAKIRFFPNTLTYGIESKGNFFVNAYSLNDGIFAQIGLRMSNKVQSQGNNKQDSTYTSDIQSALLHSELFGLFNLYNIMAAVLAIKALTDESLQKICDLVEQFGGVSGRMEVVSNNPLIIIDFAHTTDGMEKIFESFKTKKISVVFGAGGNRDKSKRAKMGASAAKYANKIYITNDNPRSEEPNEIANEIVSGIDSHQFLTKIQSSLKIILDRKEAIRQAIKDLPKDWVLLILGKGDECEQIFKDSIIQFSDKECVREILQKEQ